MDTRRHYTTPQATLSRAECETLIRLALAEDSPEGDPTSEAVFAPRTPGKARVIAREAGVLCGLPLIAFLLEIDAEINEKINAEKRGDDRGPGVTLRADRRDGDSFEAGDVLCSFTGPLRDILRLERIILNFLQYLSGISSETARTVALAGPHVSVLDTRKTLPGYRAAAKYAVYTGGGTNHRLNLSDMAMLKDNHIAAAGGITRAAGRVRSLRPDLPLEIEVDSPEQIPEALAARPRVILLDNMTEEDLDKSLGLIRAVPENERPLAEVSGGLTPEKLAALGDRGEIGASLGYLTHTTRFLDLSMEIEPGEFQDASGPIP